MRIASMGHAVFAGTLIGLGVLGLVHGELVALWRPVFRSVPHGDMLGYLSAVVSLACGAGLLWPRSAAVAARLLLVYLLAWSALFKLPILLIAPAVEGSWQSCGETAVIVAAAWALHASLGAARDGRRSRFATGGNGLRIASTLYGLAMIAFGLSHFAYLELTAPLVPAWLPAHVAWAYFTGCTYIAAGVAMIVGFQARLAAVLSTLQMGMFTFLVWIPVVAAGASVPQWGEFVMSWTLTAAGWVVADAWRGMPWFAPTRASVPRAPA